MPQRRRKRNNSSRNMVTAALLIYSRDFSINSFFAHTKKRKTHYLDRHKQINKGEHALGHRKSLFSGMDYWNGLLECPLTLKI